jgi:hypothetical protein
MSKYGNQPIMVDNVLFDSKREAMRYLELKILQQAGVIEDLKLQHKFEIVPKSSHGSALYYIADFVYQDNGRLVVEDSKGVRTPLYKLKKRLVAERYGIQIIEI